MVSSDDNDALVVILSKYIKVTDDLERDAKIRDQAVARIHLAEKQRQNCVAALKLFDVDFSKQEQFSR